MCGKAVMYMLCTVLYHIRIVTNKEVQSRFLFVLSTSVFFDNVSSENLGRID